MISFFFVKSVYFLQMMSSTILFDVQFNGSRDSIAIFGDRNF